MKITNQPAKWIRVSLALVIIVIWLIVGSIGGMAFGKINNVVNNNESSFLPKSAQSTQVINKASAFQSSSDLPAILLIISKNKITPQDLIFEQNLTRSVKHIKGVISTKSNPIIGPIQSKTKQASEIIIQTKTSFGSTNVINKFKQLTNNHPKNLSVYVTGPAGIVQAFSNAFKGVNGILTYVAVAAVLLILFIIYRSLYLPFIVLFTSLFSLTLAILVVYNLALHNIVKLNGESQGILSILVIGASTDYSIFIVSRFRENLHKIDSTFASAYQAILKTWEPISAAATTVIIALLMLLFSELNSNRSLGPIAAIGIFASYLGAMTLLPALLITFGRHSFWPFKIKVDSLNNNDNSTLNGSKFWNRFALMIKRNYRLLWISLTVLFVIISAIGLPMLKASGVSQTQSILSSSEAVKGQNLLSNYFPAGSGNPIEIITNASNSISVINSLKHNPQISTVSFFKNVGEKHPKIVNHNVLIEATSYDPPQSSRAYNLITKLRNSLSKISPSTIVGGQTAVQLDTNTAAKHDLMLIIPLVLIVIFIILIILLRSILAPVLLILSVILSFATTMAIAALVFDHLFHFPGADPSVPLFGFIFLVALGVDYNIFLMTRVREESLKLNTKVAVLKGLSITGNVITAAGLVLAVTFAALSVIPILFLAQIAFIVSFGVLLDTIIVRSIIVPSLCEDIGKNIWWPSKLK